MKTEILDALERFISQRPGLEPGNYINDWRDVEGSKAYYSDSRRITRDLHHARELLRAVSWRDSITAQDLIEASKGDRLTIKATDDGVVSVDYCTGQYWATEYRAAVARVLSNALWHYWRQTECANLDASDIRHVARRELPRAIARRFFN
jgi:hypothetical protein